MVKNNSLKWDSVKSYLKSIGIVSDVDINRVNVLFSQGTVMCPEKLKDIFVSNYEQSNGKSQFKDLWLFSDNYVIEALNFNTMENPKLDMTIFSKNIQEVAIEANNLNFSQKARDISKLHIVFYTLGDFSCDQIASGVNCDTLMYIFKTYIKHNLVRGRSPDLT